ncbi:MAG TPA: alcohol dehydrogenase catalytic domain-containing protein [Acidimicrobiia bacterium]|nr:alcohol dehydrogenase catalytic domain-containing protein [Acidimicrobiia bacterium]
MRLRAAVLTEIGRQRPYAHTAPLSVVPVELDPPGPGELLVRVLAAGVCHSDLSVVDGNRARPTPMVLGHEGAGIIEEVGEGVVGADEGDHVVFTFVPSCGLCAECQTGRPALCRRAAVSNQAGAMLRGGRRLHREGERLHHHLGVSAFAEYAVVDRGSAVVIPGDIPFHVAALLGCAVLTGYGAVVNTADARPGQSAAIFGLGGVGLAAVMSAVVAGLRPVFAVDPIEAKRDLAIEIGADAAFVPDEATEAIPAATDGGVDIGVEAAGHAAVLATVLGATRRGGTTVAVGLPHPDAKLEVPALSFAGSGKRLLGSYMGDASPGRDIPRLVGLWRSGKLPLERLHTHTRPLDEINTAFDLLADGDAIRQIIQPHDNKEDQ